MKNHKFLSLLAALLVLLTGYNSISLARLVGSNLLGVAQYGQPALTDPSTDKIHANFLPDNLLYENQALSLFASTGVSGVTGSGSGTGFTYSNPSKKLLITSYIVHMYGASGVTPGTISVGTNSSTYDNIIPATTLTNLDAVDEYTVVVPAQGAKLISNGETITYKWSGWSGTASLSFIPVGLEL